MSNKPDDENGNNLSKAWLLTLLIPLIGFLIWQIYSSLDQRVSAVENRQDSETSDISEIKSDVAYIKGFLQQKYSASISSNLINQ